MNKGGRSSMKLYLHRGQHFRPTAPDKIVSAMAMACLSWHSFRVSDPALFALLERFQLLRK